MLERHPDIPTAMRRHSIEPTVFVVSKSSEGQVNVMAAGWNVKCSYDPPMMAVALSKNGHTHTVIPQTKEFVLAVPSPELREQLEYVGSVTGSEVDKFSNTELRTQTADEIDVPLLSDARVNFECQLDSVVPTGDHFLFIGRIVAAHYNPDKEQLYFAGRTLTGERVFKSVKTTFAEDQKHQ
jgi:flavin reductase (DIM6/NTAB) family NADH-FMN oxidoreductase RutF